MKKTLSILLALSMLVLLFVPALTNTVFASASSDELPYWTISDDQHITVTREYSTAGSCYAAKVTSDGGHADDGTIYYPLTYYIPESKLIDGHNYSLEYTGRRILQPQSSLIVYVYFCDEVIDWNWNLNARVYRNEHRTGNQKTGSALKANNVIKIGIKGHLATAFYIESIVLHDDTTGGEVELENSDFGYTNKDYLPYWTPTVDSHITVTREYVTEDICYAAKIVSDGGGESSSANALTYYIPTSKLTDDHQYYIEYTTRDISAVGSVKILVYFCEDYRDWTHDITSGTKYHNTKDGSGDMRTGIQLKASGQNVIKFEFSKGNVAAAFYVENVILHDYTDGTVVELENSDFSHFNKDYLPYWTTTTDSHITVTREYSTAGSCYAAKIASDGGHANDGTIYYPLTYYIPTSKLIDEHNYSLEYTGRRIMQPSSDLNVVVYFCDEAIDWNWNLNARVYRNEHRTGNQKTGSALKANNIIKIGIKGHLATAFYIESIVLHDDTAGNTVDLKNSDFSKIASDYTLEINTEKQLSGWSNLQNNGDGNITVIGPTDYDARSGDWAICAIFKNQKTYRKEYIQNTKAQVTLKAGTEYSFGVWYKVEDDNWRTGAKSSAFMGVGSVSGSKDFGNVNTTAQDGWFKYYTTYTPETDITGYLYFGFDANYSGFEGDTKVLFDDLYAYESGSDVNLIYNGSFEEFEKEFIPEIDPDKRLEGWSGWQNNDDGNITVAGLTDFDARSGDWSLCAIFKGATKTYRKEYIQNTNAKVTLKAGKEYSFGVWYKVGDGNWRTGSASSAFMGVGTVSGSRNFGSVNTIAEDGWFKYYTTYTPENDITGYLYFGFDANYSSFENDTKVLFDDLYAYESGSDVNLVYNGSFEDYYVINSTKPVRFVAYSASNVNKGNAVVAWKNPETADIKDITLKVNNEKVHFDAVTTSKGYNEVVLKGLTDNLEYACELKFTIGENTYTYSKSFVQNSAGQEYNAVGNIPLGDWHFLRCETFGNYCNTTLELDKETKYSGTSSMRITGGRNRSANDVCARLLQYVTLKKNKAYRFTAKVKSEGLDNAVAVMMNNWTTIDTISEAKDWTTITVDIPANDGEADDDETYASNVIINVVEGADAIWIDDITLHELKRGAPTGDNLIKNGGFEYNDEWVVRSYQYNQVLNGEASTQVNSLGTGEMLGSVYLQNYSRSNFGLALIAAIYENNQLVDISISEPQEIPITVSPFVNTRIGCSVTVPQMNANKDYKMKIALWDSIGGMLPITKAEVLE